MVLDITEIYNKNKEKTYDYVFSKTFNKIVSEELTNDNINSTAINKNPKEKENDDKENIKLSQLKKN